RRAHPDGGEPGQRERGPAQSAGGAHGRTRHADRKDRTGPQPVGSDDRPPESHGDALMSDEVKPITVTILDKDYLVGCKEDEREALFASVQFLNKKMIEQRDSGKVIGSERIAVMVALNIAHE